MCLCVIRFVPFTNGIYIYKTASDFWREKTYENSLGESFRSFFCAAASVVIIVAVAKIHIGL